MQNLDSFTVAVISGLFTTFLIAAFNQIWVKIIAPWYEEKVYSDAKIEGRWEGKYPKQKGAKDVVEIERKGHAVSGRIITVSGPDKKTAYEFNGTFRNLIFTATYEGLDKTKLDEALFH